MSNQSISVDEALVLIAKGENISNFNVSVSANLDAVAAFKLRKNGVEVLEKFITYNDEDLAHDDDFDEGEWKLLPSMIAEENLEEVDVKLTINKDIKIWLKNNKVELDILLTNLLKNYYDTDELIHKNK